MASQRDIRRRIGSVRNIKQITRAMQFVAASKLKRAQDATLAARPYSEKLDEVLADLAAVMTVGRKGRDAMRRSHVPLEAHFGTFGDRPTFADVLPLARLVTDDFVAGTYGRVDIAYSHWVSTLVQRPTMLTILPVRPAEDTDGIPGNQF